jgi:hypothetical protein
MSVNKPTPPRSAFTSPVRSPRPSLWSSQRPLSPTRHSSAGESASQAAAHALSGDELACGDSLQNSRAARPISISRALSSLANLVSNPPAAKSPPLSPHTSHRRMPSISQMLDNPPITSPSLTPLPPDAVQPAEPTSLASSSQSVGSLSTSPCEKRKLKKIEIVRVAVSLRV